MLQHGRDMSNNPASSSLDSVFYLPSTGEDHPDEWPMDGRSLAIHLVGGRKTIVACARMLAALGVTVLLTSAWQPAGNGPEAVVAATDQSDPEITGSIGSGLRPTLNPETP
jgi:hypothetical protein